MAIPDNDPIVTIPMITPFDRDDQVDHDVIVRNVRRWAETPLSGFIIGSQSGEEGFLSELEKTAIAKTTFEALGGRGFVVGGIDCPSVTETLHRAEAFADSGAEMVRVRFPRNGRVVVNYFEQVLTRCPVPVLLMHQCNPERFGLAGVPAASPETLGEICSMDGVFGYVTDHDIRFESRVRKYVPQSCRFWICNGSLTLAGTLIGCNGITTAFSNIWPEALYDILQLGMNGRYDDARDLQAQVEQIDAIMLPYFAAGIKAAMNLRGYEGTHPRKPTEPFPEAKMAQLEQAMLQAGLLNRNTSNMG